VAPSRSSSGRPRPLAVDRQQAPPGQAQRVLDDAAAEGHVRLQEVRRKLREGAGEHVLPRRAAGAGAGEDELEPPQAVGRPVELGAAGLLEGLHLRERALRLREAALKVLGGAREAGEGVLAAPLQLEPQRVLGARHPVERRLEPFDGPGIGGGRRGTRCSQRVADQDGEQEPG
jgi:hypothetical protein